MLSFLKKHSRIKAINEESFQRLQKKEAYDHNTAISDSATDMERAAINKLSKYSGGAFCHNDLRYAFRKTDRCYKECLKPSPRGIPLRDAITVLLGISRCEDNLNIVSAIKDSVFRGCGTTIDKTNLMGV